MPTPGYLRYRFRLMQLGALPIRVEGECPSAIGTIRQRESDDNVAFPALSAVADE